MVLGSQSLETIIINKLKIMHNKLKLLPIIALVIINSCSFANKSTVIVPVNSNPPGADVVIDGRNYGQTPTFVELTPNKNYKATISKKGYGSANIDMDTWYSVRGGEDGDGKRCLADSAAVLPIMMVLLFAPEKCGSFKQSDYFVDISGGRTSGVEEMSVPVNNQNQVNQNNYYQNYQQPNNQYRGQMNSQTR